MSTIIPLPSQSDKPRRTDDPATGLSLLEADAALLERWPHLARPGPQPCNRIAATAAEQLARAQSPRAPESLPPAEAGRLLATLREHQDQLRPLLLDLLAEDIGAIVAEVVKHMVPERKAQYGEAS
jgi:hypothetical protein